jgi:POU domain transcription factor, class 4
MTFTQHLISLQGDIFSGLNDGLLSRAEALAAVDMQKHQNSHAHQQMTQQLKVNKLGTHLKTFNA